MSAPVAPMPCPLRQTRTRKLFPEYSLREENRLKLAVFCCPCCCVALSDIFQRQGFTRDRSLLSGWVNARCQLLSPMVKALSRYELTVRRLHADNTTVSQQATANDNGLTMIIHDDRNAGSMMVPAV